MRRGGRYPIVLFGLYSVLPSMKYNWTCLWAKDVEALDNTSNQWMTKAHSSRGECIGDCWIHLKIFNIAIDILANWSPEGYSCQLNLAQLAPCWTSAEERGKSKVYCSQLATWRTSVSLPACTSSQEQLAATRCRLCAVTEPPQSSWYWTFLLENLAEVEDSPCFLIQCFIVPVRLDLREFSCNSIVLPHPHLEYLGNAAWIFEYGVQQSAITHPLYRVQHCQLQLLIAPQVSSREAVPVIVKFHSSSTKFHVYAHLWLALSSLACVDHHRCILRGSKGEDPCPIQQIWLPFKELRKFTCTLVTRSRPPFNNLNFLPSSSSL